MFKGMLLFDPDYIGTVDRIISPLDSDICAKLVDKKDLMSLLQHPEKIALVGLEFKWQVR